MFGTIVLRHLPTDEVHIDGAYLAIQGGFRGFSEVPPSCWHYVSIQSGDRPVGFWCWLNLDDVIVKAFDPDRGWIDDDPEATVAYQDLVRNGAMESALRPYPHDFFGSWYGIVSYLRQDAFPPVLHNADASVGESRFVNAFLGTHQGDLDAFLGEFQYAFLCWLIDSESDDQTSLANVGFDRWLHLLLAVYNAGEFSMSDHAELFAKLVDILLRQFDCLGDSFFEQDSALISQIDYLIEDMSDTEISELIHQSQKLENYLQTRLARASNAST